MMVLGEFEQDALTEIFNVGMGLAADALQQMTGQHVPLSVPVVALGTQAIAHQIHAGREQPLVAIRQTFHGEFATEAVLMFAQDSCLTLTRMMVGPELAPESLDEVMADAMSELGNIILNAVMAELGDELGVGLEGSLPTVGVMTASGLFADAPGEASGAGEVLVLMVDFQFSEPLVPCYMAFLLDRASSECLIAHLRHYLAGPAA